MHEDSSRCSIPMPISPSTKVFPPVGTVFFYNVSASLQRLGTFTRQHCGSSMKLRVPRRIFASMSRGWVPQSPSTPASMIQSPIPSSFREAR